MSDELGNRYLVHLVAQVFITFLDFTLLIEHDLFVVIVSGIAIASAVWSHFLRMRRQWFDYFQLLSAEKNERCD